jgi:hypothetical protein
MRHNLTLHYHSIAAQAALIQLSSTGGRRPNARHHPPRIQRIKHPSLADESYAMRGRVHAVVRLPSIEIAQRSPPTSTGMTQRPPRRLQKQRKRGGQTVGRKPSTVLSEAARCARATSLALCLNLTRSNRTPGITRRAHIVSSLQADG